MIRSAPKVLLHDHLDGGLRPPTVIELAQRRPATATCPRRTRRSWGAGSGPVPTASRLELYLEGFRHTVAVMQTPDAIARVASECAQDLAADGIVYAEVRYAPELSTQEGLPLEAVMEAWLDGFEQGARAAAAAGRPIVIRAIVTAMRQLARSVEIAELSVRYRDEGVVGFDIAGPEAGFPPSRHLDAFQLIHHANFHVTIHAGEAFGLPSIWEALQWCGAERLGHGVRIVDDITRRARRRHRDGPPGPVRPRRPRAAGDVSHLQRAHRCRGRPSRTHPIDLLRRLRFRVTVNTDNRLMSGVSLSDEFASLVGPSASASTRCSGCPRTP